MIDPAFLSISASGAPIVPPAVADKWISDESHLRGLIQAATNPGCSNESSCGGSTNDGNCTNSNKCGNSSNSGACHNYGRCDKYTEEQ